MSTNSENHFDIVFISDVHLGSKMSHAKELKQFLRRTNIEKLVLVGDIFDDLDMRRLSEAHFKVLVELRKLSKNKSVIWVRGNHDGISNDLMTALIGVEVFNQYVWQHNNLKYMAIHGDIWDVIIYQYKFLTKVFTKLFQVFQNINTGLAFKITRQLKTWSKEFTRNVQAVQNGAIQYAKRHGADIIVCGHTHYAQLLKDSETGIIYANDGTWQTDIPSFIGVRGTTIGLYRFQNEVITNVRNLELGEQ